MSARRWWRWQSMATDEAVVDSLMLLLEFLGTNQCARCRPCIDLSPSPTRPFRALPISFLVGEKSYLPCLLGVWDRDTTSTLDWDPARGDWDPARGGWQ